MKPGRNDPCPCGSGKKYKNCCLAKDSAPHGTEFLWHRLRQLNDGLITHLLETAVETFGVEAVYEAWDEFMLWDEAAPGFDPESPHTQVFWPWFYYDWRPDPHEPGTRVKPGAPTDRTVAEVYLNRRHRQLDPLARRYLEACIAAPFSFHEVVACDPGKGFVLRDILSGAERHVTERQGSAHAQPGDILFAKVVAIDELAEIDGCAPVLIPPADKAPILELRAKIAGRNMPITPELLKDYDLEMFAIYHDLVEALINPPLPELQNTDGDPLLLHKLIYDIDSPQAAFDALKGLALGVPDDELLAEAKREPDGALRKVEFAWLKHGNKQHKHWDTTVLGHIGIDGRVLTVEVNSARRAKKFQTLAKKLLGRSARYRTTVIESPEAALTRGASPAAPPETHEALMANPEVQAQLAKFVAAHYESWVDTKVPALGNKTPRQAVKTRDGREMVEALLTQMERDMRDETIPGNETLIQDLRRRLKLD